MNLDAYMKSTGYTDESFGERIGRSRLQVFKYRHGLAIPRKIVMNKITKVSKGQVAESSFFSDIPL